METNQNTTIIRTLFEEVLSKGNISKCSDFIAKDIVLHDPAFTKPIRGLDAFTTMEMQYTQSFPGKKAIIEELFTTDDKVIVRWRCQGTHKGSFNGISATNKPFNISGISIYRFDRGKIVEVWQNWDRLGLLEQIGEINQVYEMSR
jgi:steroid delta-isomerase-like uncharacterized protein